MRPGHLFTKGPGTYKIPSVNDIPVDFRVQLLANAPNVRAIHSSKVRAPSCSGKLAATRAWPCAGGVTSM